MGNQDPMFPGIETKRKLSTDELQFLVVLKKQIEYLHNRVRREVGQKLRLLKTNEKLR